MADPATYLPEIRARLQNPAVPDDALMIYITSALREVSPDLYSDMNTFDAQVLDTTCQLLAIDGKFPEISSVSSQGLTTSFSPNDPERYTKRINARRQASWMK